MTAWQLVKEGRPFTEMLTTNRFVMTTALKSLYIQIEMPADAPFGNNDADAGLDDRLLGQRRSRSRPR